MGKNCVPKKMDGQSSKLTRICGPLGHTVWSCLIHFGSGFPYHEDNTARFIQYGQSYHNGWFTLWWFTIANYWKLPFIVRFPFKKRWFSLIFHSYVSLPEGKLTTSVGKPSQHQATFTLPRLVRPFFVRSMVQKPREGHIISDAIAVLPVEIQGRQWTILWLSKAVT